MVARRIVVFHPVPTVAHALRSALEAPHESVFVAADTATFLDQAARADCAVLGIGGDDLSALDTLMAHSEKSDVPVVIAGPMNNPERIVRMFRFGARDYCSLPLEGDELAGRVLAALKKSTHHPRCGDYRLGRRLGQGGMGIVFDAHHVRDESPAAVKMLLDEARDDPVAGARFEREIAALQSLSHPHVVGYLADGTARGARYVVMARVHGQALYRCTLDADAVTRVGAQIASALATLHLQDWVHRDVKPDNVFVDNQGHAVLIDLGTVAQKGQRRLTPRSSRIGTPRYVAPEQMQGRAEARSDQYSLGCTLFESLTARAPFDDEDHDEPEALLAAKQTADVRVRSYHLGCSSLLDDVIAKMMAPRPKDRYASMLEVKAALDEIAPPVPADRTEARAFLSDALKDENAA